MKFSNDMKLSEEQKHKLSKYNSVKNSKENIFDKMKWCFLDEGLSLDTVGLYVYISMGSGQLPITNGRRGINWFTQSALLNDLALDRSNAKRNADWLKHQLIALQELGWIMTDEEIPDKKTAQFQLLLNDPKPELKSYSAIYYSGVKRIIHYTNGRHRLKCLGMYAVIRSYIFAGSSQTESHVVTHNIGYIANRANVSTSTCRRLLKDLVQYKTLASFKINDWSHGDKFVYADMIDYELLAKYVAGEIDDGRYIDVLE